MGHIPTHPPAPAELWGVDELAAYLGVTEHFVYRLTKQHRIRFVRVGRTARFRPADVAAWLQAEAVPPPGPSRSRPSPAGADPRPGTAGSEHGAQADLAERYRYLGGGLVRRLRQASYRDLRHPLRGGWSARGVWMAGA